MNRSTPTCSRLKDPLVPGPAGPGASGIHRVHPHAEGTSMDLQLTGKRAVVTGGSRGIGYAIASALAAEGADLALLARDAARLHAAAQELAAGHGCRGLALPARTTPP